MIKNRIVKLEEIIKKKLKPKHQNLKVNYDNKLSDEEREDLTKQGIKIIDVVYV